MKAAYLSLTESELDERIAHAGELLSPCRLCPRECGVNRLAGELGVCGIGHKAPVTDYGPHHGEEDVLVGKKGSGTIFFAGCNLGCVFCQNHEISMNPDAGYYASPEELAGTMLTLQERGCHNINFVTPTHVMPMIIEALPVAIRHGLSLPLVYNCGGYESLEALSILDGIIDIYMPDVKFWDEEPARKYLKAADYPDRAREAVTAMFEQVGTLQTEDGLAIRGLLVRHLVMPGGLAGTGEWLQFLAAFDRNTAVNIMGQYRPCADAVDDPDIGQSPTMAEMDEAFELARKAGITPMEAHARNFWERIGRK